MMRKSYDCSKTLLAYIMDSQHLFSKMTEKDVVEIINFAPSNLKEFFDRSIIS